MSNIQTTTQQQIQGVKDFLFNPSTMQRFETVLGERTGAYLTSILSLVNGNPNLLSCDKNSLFTATLASATLNLPVNNNLGFAYIVPYKGKAQLQLGYRSYIQLAQRTGLMKTIEATEVYENEIVSRDRLRGNTYNFNVKNKGELAGYVAFFSMTNGFEAELFMSVTEIDAHAKKYSQTYKKGHGLWKTDFDSMAKKTVLKLLLSKKAPMTVEMNNLHQAVNLDQSVVMDNDGMLEPENYPDNEVDPIEDAIIDSEGAASEAKAKIVDDKPSAGNNKKKTALLKVLSTVTTKMSEELPRNAESQDRLSKLLTKEVGEVKVFEAVKKVLGEEAPDHYLDFVKHGTKEQVVDVLNLLIEEL